MNCGDSLMVEQLTFQLGGGGSIPTSPLQLLFKPISDKTANMIVEKFHYAHRAVPTSWSFGAFFDGLLCGVLTIGKPASHSLCEGCCGERNADRVFELNRLWLSDIAPHNSESRFIGWTLRQLRKGIILVSYADTGQRHLGVIYQATNWIYTGATKERTDIAVEVGKHSRHYDKNGDYSKRQLRTSKHRYVYFTDKADRELLLWKELPYPKVVFTGLRG